MTPEPRSRLRIGVGAAIVLVLVALGVAVVAGAMAPRGGSVTVAPGAVPTAVGGSVFVHVLGAVRSPGLYELRNGARTVDAIAAAGGFTDDADQAQLNLARVVDDGEQIAVPRAGEAPPPGPAGVDAGGKVDLNTADAATLETLPRIGPAMAERIIAWRDENGRFASVDDLGQVTGIGEKTLDGLRDLVTV